MPNDHVLIYSGCAWGDSGGAQRPAQIARRLARMGYRVSYRSEVEKQESTMIYGEGDLDIGPATLPPPNGWGPGVVIVCLPSYWPYVKRLGPGWRVVYDYLDWWEGFVAEGALPAEVLNHEPELMATASAVVCSAPQLAAAAALKLPGLRTEVILNGGPDEMVPAPYIPLRDVPDAVYAGYMLGPWMDWTCLANVAARLDMRLHMIGKYQEVTDIREQMSLHTGDYRWHGELDHEVCLKVLSQMSVGVIPFMGKLSNYVSPIKHYDYAAAGLWSVYTPDLWPMLDTDYSILAAPADFPDAIQEAHEMRRSLSVSEEYVQANSWTARADQYHKLIQSIPDAPERAGWAFTMDEAPWTPDQEEAFDVLKRASFQSADNETQQRPRPRARHANDVGLQEDDCPLRVTLAAPSSCNMDPPCHYCSNLVDRQGRPPLAGPGSRWTDGLLKLGREHGPLYLSACYGEPLSDPETVRVLAAVARENKVDLVSNIIAPPTVLAPFSRNGNTRIATSYHPHYWRSHGQEEGFAAQRRFYELSGIDCGSILVVAHPAMLDDAWAMKARLQLACRAEDIRFMPFHGRWRGGVYPEAFDAKQKLTVEMLVADTYPDQPGGIMGETRGKLCRAGMDYVFINPMGDIHRCYMESPKIGNILDGEWELATSAAPCPAAYCPCPDMWSYIEDSAGAETEPIPQMAPPVRAVPAEMYREHVEMLPEDDQAEFVYINPRTEVMQVDHQGERALAYKRCGGTGDSLSIIRRIGRRLRRVAGG